MITFPSIDPVAVTVGPLSIHWYAISYIVGIFGCIFYAQKLSEKYSLNITKKDLDLLFTYIVLGIIIGGRTGYVMIYDPIKYFSAPMEMFQTYKGGMSFHGGFAGFIIASYIFCRKYKIEYLKLMDLAAIVTPFAIFLGRIANFINGELYGRVTNVSWSMIFPDSDGLPRHPSQLYEAALEGLLLLAIMYFTSKKLYKTGYNIGVFLILYSGFRIFCEYFREPDIQIGFVISGITMGQILSIPTLLLGAYFYIKATCQSIKK
jgi:phosphatidylglycerol:prolipoprotein diacylglycerol transferase